MADVKTQDAVTRNLEILGEATKNLSEEFRARYSHIPWKNMAGVHNRLIHHYFGINLDIVWQIVVAELPDVITALDEVVDDDTV